ncbi:hypothetical protein [Bdellovibrio sp. HCB337]|uniref:hypothetical protein n=1 Tax=Bdellovibrio sp. HCB337 TaxID=3394358 RepID=UPI0039A4C403
MKQSLFIFLAMSWLYIDHSYAARTPSRDGSSKCTAPVQQPISAKVDIINSRRIHVQLIPGMDSRGEVIMPDYDMYKIYDASNNVIYQMSGLYLGDSSKLWDVEFDGLKPSSSYRFEVVSHLNFSQGSCKTFLPAKSSTTFRMPADIFETAAPVIFSDLKVISTWIGLGSWPAIQVFADDDTSIDSVEFFFDGVSVRKFTSTTARLIANADGSDVDSTIVEGSQFTYTPTKYQVGKTVEVTVVLIDVFGNKTVSSKKLFIP